jgi:hypothetical protein
MGIMAMRKSNRFDRAGRRLWAKLAVGLAFMLATTLILQGSAVAATVVDDSNLGVDWGVVEQRAGSTYAFASGPATPPYGSGSFQITMADGVGKITLFTWNHVGTRLDSIASMGISTYRSSASTNPITQFPSINVEVDFVGDGSSFTTLVFESYYTYGQGALDTWQSWDAILGGDAIWWSTKDIPGVCAFNCFVSWDTIVANNPNAVISGGFGVNTGSGWNGNFEGAADGLAINGTVYDFEPGIPVIGPPTSMDECKNGGWQQFNTPRYFWNQGDCVSYVQTGQ